MSGIPELALDISSHDKLFASYMPLIKNGGLFVATAKNFQLGDEIILVCKIMDAIEPHKIIGKVVWITPMAALGNRPTGIGVQFSHEDTVFKNILEAQLGDSLQSEQRSNTF